MKLITGIAESNKPKEICPNGSDQLPVNKGDVLLALDNIQAPSARSSMKGKTKLDGTTVHISDLPHIPQRRYTYKLDKNLASTSILPQLLLMNPPYKHVTSSAKDKEVLMVADNGSVRADEMPRGSTDPDDDNLWRRYGSSWCAIIQGLLPNADIHAHANNDLLWSYATGGEGGIDENNRERSSGESSGEEIKGAWYEAYQLTAAIQAKMSKEAAKALSEETQAAEIHA